MVSHAGIDDALARLRSYVDVLGAVREVLESE